MKKLLFAALLLSAVTSRADPFFQHASLSPSNMQGELFTGAMRTNAGISQATLLPIFYKNALQGDPWYKPSFAPLVVGGSSGNGSASGEIGSVIDVGQQLIMGLEDAVGLFSQNGKADIVNFFSCSASATACATISTGALFNLNIEQAGKFSTTWKELGAHPLGIFLGPSITFGGATGN